MCYQATPEARQLAEDFKRELGKMYENEALVLVPNCIYRCGCPEFHPCGFWDRFWKYVTANYDDTTIIFDIDKRYEIYRDLFLRGGQHEL